MKQCKKCGEKDQEKLRSFYHTKSKKIVYCSICKECYGNSISESVKKVWENPEYKEQISNTVKEKWKDIEFREKTIIGCKKRWENPEERKRMSEEVKKRTVSDETKEKMSKNMSKRWSNPETKRILRKKLYDFNNKPEQKFNRRKQMIKRIADGLKDGNSMQPNIGKNEKQLLDKIEQEKSIKLERQFPVLGFWVDGYDKKNNVVYEVHEKFHKKPSVAKKDAIRQQQIIAHLKCKFIIIPDY